jgi:hypothetical protein
MITKSSTEVIELFLPEDTLKWFDIIRGEKSKDQILIVLEEKNNPPLPSWYKGEQILSKGFKDISISDFPIRGKKGIITFRRRTWQIEGHSARIKREIKLAAEGTTLEKEFADFLKE